MSDKDYVAIEEIAPEVLEILQVSDFFDRLEREVFPHGDHGVRLCQHDYRLTAEVLTGIGIEREAHHIFIAVLQSRGGMCDCEVLYNVDDREDSPKARYWLSRSSATEIAG